MSAEQNKDDRCHSAKETSDRICFLHMQRQFLCLPEFFCHLRRLLCEPLFQRTVDVADQQRNNDGKLHFELAARGKYRLRRAILQKDLGITEHPGPDQISHKAENMIERQETQCAKRAAAFRGDLLTFLRVYDRPSLQADLLSAKDIDLSRVSGPRSAESKLIGSAALCRLRVAAQQIRRICLRQRNSGSRLCTYESDGTCLTEQVHQLFIIKRGIEKQRFASGSHQPPENNRPALTGLKSQTDPLIAPAQPQAFNPAEYTSILTEA